jgi:hypothetical protein
MHISSCWSLSLDAAQLALSSAAIGDVLGRAGQEGS